VHRLAEARNETHASTSTISAQERTEAMIAQAVVATNGARIERSARCKKNDVAATAGARD
jgi:hypothetical protein